MADISQINLPDGTTYNLKDSYARTNYVFKAGDTMTGNLTAPKFIGALQGNADTATNVTWTGITNKPDVATEQEIASYTEASGSIATFSDGSPLPMRSLKAYIEPVQDLHGYDAPWVGGAGKNKCNALVRASQTINGITSEIKKDNLIVASGTSTGNGDIGIVLANDISVSANSNYTVSIGGSNSGGIILFFRDTDGNYYGPIYRETGLYVYKYTFASAISIHEILFRATNGITININGNIQIELGSTATSFAPYSNECPISGHSEANVTRCGKNLFDKTATDTNKGYISGKWINQTGNTFSYGDWNVSEYIRVDGEKITVNGMTISGQVSSGRGGYCCYDKYKNVLGGGTYNALTQVITLPTNTKYIRISVWNENKDVCQLELSEAATTYEPYNGSTYTIQFTDGSNPLTVYEGYVDIVSGTLTVTWIRRNMGSLTYTKSQSGLFKTTISGIKRPLTNTQPTGWVISSIYKEIDARSITGPQGSNPSPDGVMAVNEAGEMYFNNWAYTEISDFINGMNGVDLVYELATPQTYQLTPTQVKSLLWVNNVWCDTGDVELEYQPQNVIAELRDEIQQAEGRLTLANYTSSTYTTHTSASQLRANLTTKKNCGIDSTSNGGVLIASNWTSNTYNSEIFMGMGDNPVLYYRGKNNGTYCAWRQIITAAGGTMTGTLKTPADNSKGLEPADDGVGRIGSPSAKYNAMYAYEYVGNSGVYVTTNLSSPTSSDATYMWMNTNDLFTSGTWDGTTGSLKTALGSLKIGLGAVITYKDFTCTSASVPANASKEFASVNVAKTGYTPIGFLKYNTGDGSITPVNLYLEGNNAILVLRNVSSTAKSVAPTFRILYMKTTS